jgi:hypothetical protein
MRRDRGQGPGIRGRRLAFAPVRRGLDAPNHPEEPRFILFRRPPRRGSRLIILFGFGVGFAANSVMDAAIGNPHALAWAAASIAMMNAWWFIRIGGEA